MSLAGEWGPRSSGCGQIVYFLNHPPPSLRDTSPKGGQCMKYNL